MRAGEKGGVRARTHGHIFGASGNGTFVRATRILITSKMSECEDSISARRQYEEKFTLRPETKNIKDLR